MNRYRDDVSRIEAHESEYYESTYGFTMRVAQIMGLSLDDLNKLHRHNRYFELWDLQVGELKYRLVLNKIERPHWEDKPKGLDYFSINTSTSSVPVGFQVYSYAEEELIVRPPREVRNDVYRLLLLECGTANLEESLKPYVETTVVNLMPPPTGLVGF